MKKKLLAVILFSFLLIPFLLSADNAFLPTICAAEDDAEPPAQPPQPPQVAPPAQPAPAKDSADKAAAAASDKLYDVSLGKGAISLEDLVVFIRDTLKIQIIYDRRIFSGDGVNYVVNVKPMTAEELLPFLRDTLQRYGYNIASVGEADKPIYYIYKAEGQQGQPGAFKVPAPKLLVEGETAEPNQYVMRFVKLKYADASVVTTELQSLKYQDGTTVTPITATNEIALVGFSKSVDFYLEVIRNRDVEGAKLATVLVKLAHVKPSFLKGILEENLYALGLKPSEVADNKGGGESLVRITAIDDLNMLLCLVPEHKAEMIQKLIKDLDETMAPPEKEVSTKTYSLNYMDPDDASKLIADVFGGTSKNEGNNVAASKSAGTSPAEAGKQPAIPPAPEAKGTFNANNFQLEDFEVPTIVRVPNSTSLVITTSQRVHDKVRELLDLVDVKQAQVYLEAALVSVSYDSALAIGTEWSSPGAIGKAAEGFGGTAFGLSTYTPVPNYVMGGRTGFQKVPGMAFGIAKDNGSIIPILIQLSQTTSKIKVLSNPSVLANSGQESEFTTQQQVPYLSTQVLSNGSTTTSQGGTETASIEVKITPVIFDSNSIKLTVTLKVEAFTGNPSNPNLSPPKTSNVYTGTICITDNQTVVVGGLVTTDDNVVETKVPLLGDIPLLGYLFKSQTTTKNKAVLYVFITPRVMRGNMVEEYHKNAEGKIKEVENPPAK